MVHFVHTIKLVKHCLTLGLLAGGPGLGFLFEPTKQESFWAAFRPSKEVYFFLILKAQQLLCKTHLAIAQCKLEHLLSESLPHRFPRSSGPQPGSPSESSGDLLRAVWCPGCPPVQQPQNLWGRDTGISTAKVGNELP